MCKQILIIQNYKQDRQVKNRADWEKSVKEAKVRIGLQCHLEEEEEEEEEGEEGEEEGEEEEGEEGEEGEGGEGE